MKKRTEKKDTAARNRKGCIVELCVVLFFFLIALVPVFLLFSKWMQETLGSSLVQPTVDNFPSEVETKENGIGSQTAEQTQPRTEITEPDPLTRLQEEKLEESKLKEYLTQANENVSYLPWYQDEDGLVEAPRPGSDGKEAPDPSVRP